MFTLPKKHTFPFHTNTAACTVRPLLVPEYTQPSLFLAIFTSVSTVNNPRPQRQMEFGGGLPTYIPLLHSQLSVIPAKSHFQTFCFLNFLMPTDVPALPASR